MNVKILTANANLLILLIWNQFHIQFGHLKSSQHCVLEKLTCPANYVGEKYLLRTCKRPYFDLRCITRNQYSPPRTIGSCFCVHHPLPITN